MAFVKVFLYPAKPLLWPMLLNFPVMAYSKASSRLPTKPNVFAYATKTKTPAKASVMGFFYSTCKNHSQTAKSSYPHQCASLSLT